MKRILTIGNSLSENATQYLEPIMAAEGRQDLLIGKTSLGGCSLQKHWNLVKQCDLLPGVRPYDFRLTGQPSRPATLREALTAEPWDYVTLQQVSTDSWRPETYRPWINYLHELVSERAPQAQVVIHETWAYRVDSPALVQYGIDQATMHDRLTAAYADVARELGCRVLPCGTAFEKARRRLKFVPDPAYDFANPRPLELPDQSRSLIAGHYWRTGNTGSGNAELGMDDRHGNEKGCYLANAVWYEMFTGRRPGLDRFCPPGVSADMLRLLSDTAHEAVMDRGGPL